jgi:hypothetical protein
MKTSVFLFGLVTAVVAVPSDAQPLASVERDATSGRSRLVVARAQSVPIKFEVKELWRYDAASREWTRERFKPVAKVTGAGVVAEITDKVGLYWLKWTENGRPVEGQVFSGPVRCNDVSLPPPPRPDLLRACIPARNSAEANYVPDPRIHAR